MLGSLHDTKGIPGHVQRGRQLVLHLGQHQEVGH